MRRFRACCGVDGHAESWDWLGRAVADRPPDAVLFAGGILPPQRQGAEKLSPWSLSAEESAFAEQFFAALGRLGVFCAVIPGPAGEPLDEFFRLAAGAELLFPNIRAAHATLLQEGDVAVCGLGGVLSEEPLLGVEPYSRAAAEYFLRTLPDARQPRKILLLPAPPPGPLGGEEGSRLVGDLIDSCHPDLCVVAGPSARRGSQRLAGTLAVNPGRLVDGWAAWLDWRQAGAAPVEIVNLKGPG
jgi:Icc-related predicted phosphoesterase